MLRVSERRNFPHMIVPVERHWTLEVEVSASNTEEPDFPTIQLACVGMAETVMTGAQPSQETPLSMTSETSQELVETLWRRVAG